MEPSELADYFDHLPRDVTLVVGADSFPAYSAIDSREVEFASTLGKKL
jgi:hypothetical protein